MEDKTAGVALLFYSDMTMLNFIQTMNAGMADAKITTVTVHIVKDEGGSKDVVYNKEGVREA